MMHLYSSPLTHRHTEQAVAHRRPDIHAVFQLWLSLTEVGPQIFVFNCITEKPQLTWLQILEFSLALRDNVLLPTSVCGIVGVVHFAYVLFSSPLRFPSFTFLTHMVSPTWYFVRHIDYKLATYTSCSHPILACPLPLSGDPFHHHSKGHHLHLFIWLHPLSHFLASS